jgi:hypothetical protein
MTMYLATKNGVEKRIQTWRIVIPLHDNEKKPFSEAVIDQIKSLIIEQFSGFTAINVVVLGNLVTEFTTTRILFFLLMFQQRIQGKYLSFS